MPKPICLVYYSQTTGADFADVQNTMQEKWTDYYVLVIPSHRTEIIELEVFYDKDFIEMQYDELKQWIKESLEIEKIILNNDLP